MIKIEVTILVAGTFILIALTMVIYFAQGRAKIIMGEDEMMLMSIRNCDGRLPFKDLVVATEDFNEKYCIGRGSQGTVYKASVPDGKTYAVKRMHASIEEGELDETDKKAFDSEVKTLTGIRHRNIVKLNGHCSYRGNVYLVYDFVEKGSLSSVLKGEEGGKILGWEERVRIIKEVAEALSYMHHDKVPAIVHRDISTKNILLDLGLVPHVSDFGVAKLMIDNKINWTGAVGSYGYMAPGQLYTYSIALKQI